MVLATVLMFAAPLMLVTLIASMDTADGRARQRTKKAKNAEKPWQAPKTAPPATFLDVYTAELVAHHEWMRDHEVAQRSPKRRGYWTELYLRQLADDERQGIPEKP